MTNHSSGHIEELESLKATRGAKPKRRKTFACRARRVPAARTYSLCAVGFRGCQGFVALGLERVKVKGLVLGLVWGLVFGLRWFESWRGGGGVLALANVCEVFLGGLGNILCRSTSDRMVLPG